MATYLGLDIKTVAQISLFIQTFAYAMLLAGFIFAKKKDFRKHKRLMSVAFLFNMISLLVVMLPSFVSVASGLAITTGSSLIVVVHHAIGLVALVLASIVILKSCAIVKNTKALMLTIFSSWSISYFLGLYVYFMLYGIMLG